MFGGIAIGAFTPPACGLVWLYLNQYSDVGAWVGALVPLLCALVLGAVMDRVLGVLGVLIGFAVTAMGLYGLVEIVIGLCKPR